MTLLDLAYQAGLNPKWVAGTGGGEYHSPCPACGGRDRFFIQPHKQMRNCQGTYCCRQCGIYGDSIKFAQDILKYPFKKAIEIVGALLPENKPYLMHRKIHEFTSLQTPPKQWQERAGTLVDFAHQAILSRVRLLEDFDRRGLSLEVIKKYKLGWIDKTEFHQRSTWGLEASTHTKLWIPKGLLIPSIEKSGAIVRLKVRRHNIAPHDHLPRYIAISGSMNGMLCLGLLNSKTVIVVESELDAYALRNVIRDEDVTIVAVGGSSKNPDIVINKLAKQASVLLICRDNDAAGEKMFTKWHTLYHHAKDVPTPMGKDIGEAIGLGLNIKEWLLNIQKSSPNKKFARDPYHSRSSLLDSSSPLIS